jgi:FkbM family methyltransferase
MKHHGSKRDRFFGRLRAIVDYCYAFSIPRGATVGASILVARLFHRPYMSLPVPGTRRKVRLRPTSSDIQTYRQVFVGREYDFSDFPQSAHFHKRPDSSGSEAPITIVDCGANIGCSVIWFAAEFPGAEILAIEPDAANFDLLNQNVAGLENVRTIRAALWSSETLVMISNPEAEPWAYRTEALGATPGQKTAPIRTVTMDGLLAEYPPSRRLIVKIDIEGAEREVFSNNTSWLQSVDLLIVELHDWMLPGQGSGRTFFSAIASMPMDYVWRGENLFCFQIRKADSRLSSLAESSARRAHGERIASRLLRPKGCRDRAGTDKHLV